MCNSILVVKVGTSTLAMNTDGGELLDEKSFARLGGQIFELRKQGYGIVIVSSAAITAGMVVAGVDERPKSDECMSELQRLASIGWRHVLNAWERALPNVRIGELLVTRHDLASGSECKELMAVTKALLNHSDIVIVNENDALTHEEIAFGDNDTLAATFAARVRQANICSGDVEFVILTDVEGVYADRHDPKTLIPVVRDVAEISHVAGDSTSGYGTGGMTTKLLAAKIAAEAGLKTRLAHGRAENVLERALHGRAGTLFDLM